MTHPRCVGVAPTRHTSLSFIHRCAPHTRAFSFLPTSLYSLSLLSAHFGFLSARLRSGPTPAESPAPQPGNPPLQASPRLPDSDPLSGPRLTLTTWSRPPSSRPGLRPPDPEGAPIVTSPLRTGPRGPGPDRTRPDTTSRSRTPLHRAGPPASATGHKPYRPSVGRTQKPIVVVLDSTRRWISRTSPTSSPALRARTRSTTSSPSHATSQFVSQPPGANRPLATAPAVCT